MEFLRIVLIFLWILSILLLSFYTTVIARGDAEGEGAGAFKWLVVSTMIMSILMLIFLGVKTWLIR